jgi:hypothetical protein
MEDGKTDAIHLFQVDPNICRTTLPVPEDIRISCQALAEFLLNIFTYGSEKNPFLD